MIEAPPQPAWTAEELKLLGTRLDREIGRRIGRSRSEVQAKRLSLGIKGKSLTATKSGGSPGSGKVKLLFGPYNPPRTRRGKFLFCEIGGTVKVGGFSDGPIPWPIKWGTNSIILCGDLVRAVRQESALAVAHHWDVCTGIVSRWRAALDVEPITLGTHRLKSYVSSEMMTPFLRTHLSRVKTGQPRRMTRQGRARLMTYAPCSAPSGRS